MKLVDLTTAQALQELGYDGEYTKTYTDFDTCTVDVTGLKIPTEIPAPRLDDAAYWLREKYDMGIYPYSVSQTSTSAYINGDYKLHQSRWMVRDAAELMHTIYPDYDSALEAAVKKAIEINQKTKAMNDRLCANCIHYNGASEPGAGICRATNERTFKNNRCFNSRYESERESDKNKQNR